MADTHATVSNDTIKTQAPPVLAPQAPAQEQEVAVAEHGAHRAVYAAGAGSPSAPESNFTGLLGSGTSSHNTGITRQLQRAYGNQFTRAVIQRKLSVNAPGDAYEQEADHTAELVMRKAPVEMIQPKLTVNAPGDAYEQEADQVADTVMRSADGTIQRSCAACDAGGAQCDECRKKVQLKRNGAGGSGPVAPGVAAKVDSLRGSGSPMPAATARDMGARFGYDFGGVRIHTGAVAADTTRDLSAHAYTIGSDIAFAPGRFAPDTSDGKRLLAHELTHVIQQGGAAREGMRSSASQQIQRAPGDPPPSTPPAGGVPEGGKGGNEQPSSISTAVTVPITLFPGIASRKGAKGKGPTAGTETIHIPIAVESGFTATVYSVPADQVFLTKEDAEAGKPIAAPADKPAATPAPAAPAADKPAAAPATTPAAAPPAAPAVQGDAAGTVPQAAGTPPPAAAPAVLDPATTTVFTADGKALNVIGSTPHSVITSTFTKYAVGAASTGVYEGRGQLVVIDAGISTTPNISPAEEGNLAYSLMELLKKKIGGKRVTQLLITHAHADHVSMASTIMSNFEVQSVRMNELQEKHKTAQEMLTEMRQGMQEYRAQRAQQVRASMRNGKLDWIDRNTEANMSPTQQNAAWDAYVASEVQKELAKIPEPHLELIKGTPDGKYYLDWQPLSDPNAPATPIPPDAAGQLGKDIQIAHVVDPDLHTTTGEYKKGDDIPAKVVDSTATSYIMQVQGGPRFMVLPDLRAADYKRIVEQFRAEASKFKPVTATEVPPVQIWDITHHMQPGWTADGTRTLVSGASVNVRASELASISSFLHEFRSQSNAQGAGGDIVMVSVKANTKNPFDASSKVNPANMWLLRSLGFEPFIATSHADLEFLEVLTSEGRKVQGVVGKEYAGGRPKELLLKRAEAALSEMRAKVQSVEAERKTWNRKRNKEAVTEKARLDGEIKTLRENIDKVEKGKLAYITEFQNDIGRSHLDPATAGRPWVAPQPGTPEPGAVKGAELSKLLTDIGFTKPVTTGPNPRFDDVALVLLRKEQIGGDGDPSKPGSSAAELIRLRNQVELTELQLQKADRISPELQAKLLGDLHEYNRLLKEHLASGTVDGPNADLIKDQVTSIEKRIEQLAPPKDQPPAMVQRTEQGELVETKVLAEKAKTAAEKPMADPAAADAAPPAAEKPAAADAKVAEPTPVKAADPAGQPLATPKPVQSTTAAPVPDANTAGGPSANAKAAHAIATTADKAMGVVTVYQTITGEADLIDRYAQGKAGGAELAVGTAHNALNMSVSVKAIRGVPVHPGVFVVISLLDIAQTASRDYRTSEERDVAVATATARNAINLGCMVVGGALMRIPHPITVIAGLAIMFLGGPIMRLLGIEEWLSDVYSFKPRQVSSLNRELDKLLQEYEIVVGALDIAQRKQEELEKMGAGSGEDAKARAMEAVDAHRAKARGLELFILPKFTDAYQRTRTGYASLQEVDAMRHHFMTLRRRVKDPTQLGQMLTGDFKDAFKFMDDTWMSLDSMSPEEIREMEQWEKLDEKIEDFAEIIGDEDGMNWDKAYAHEDQVVQMLDNARYRLTPDAYGGYRSKPLLTTGTPAYAAYQSALALRENAVSILRTSLAVKASDVCTPVLGEMKEDVGESIFNLGEPLEVDTVINRLEKTIILYEYGVKFFPLPQGMTPEKLYADTVTNASYQEYIGGQGKHGIMKLMTLESAMVGQAELAASMMRGRSDVKDASKNRMEAALKRMETAIQHRRVVRVLLFPDEAAQRAAGIGARDRAAAAKVLGQGDAQPLSPREETALKSPEMAGIARTLTTPMDQLEQVDQKLLTPDALKMGKLFRVVGHYDHYDYTGTRVARVEDDAIVIKTGTSTLHEYTGMEMMGGSSMQGPEYTIAHVTPVSPGAVRLFGGKNNIQVEPGTLVPLKIDDQGKLVTATPTDIMNNFFKPETN